MREYKNFRKEINYFSENPPMHIFSETLSHSEDIRKYYFCLLFVFLFLRNRGIIPILVRENYYLLHFFLMLETIAIILLILWVLGLVSSYTIGGFIHILLVVAIVLFLVRVIRKNN